MSADGGLARGSSGSAGKRGSKASGQGLPQGDSHDHARKSEAGGMAEAKSGEAAPRGSASGARGSMADATRRSSANQPRGSQTRGSQGSVGQRVSFGAEGDAAKQIRSSQRQMSQRMSRLYAGEMEGEYDDYAEEHGEDCDCAECVCPPEEEEEMIEEKPPSPTTPEELGEQYQLDEFMRAKAYFQQVSSKSGLSLYDHLSDVIRKFLDERAPNNPVDYLEEVSMNVKRYRFGLKKEDTLQDLFYISEGVLGDAQRILTYWRNFAKWNDDAKRGDPGESAILPGGSFQNLLRLQYYLEQVNIGLSREEMFRLALGIKELHGSRPQIGRLRFWGKIFGTQRNYYVVEAELKFGGTDQAMDLWQPKEEENNEVELHLHKRISEGAGKGLEMNAVQTFDRAKDVVLNRDFLQTYAKTSGLTPDKQADLLPKKEMTPTIWEGEGAPTSPIAFDDAISEGRADAMKWEGYQQELMQNFPQTKASEHTEIPSEPDGSGVNRRVFYVCNELGEDWALLPAVTPQQINSSRSIRWFLTGNLDSSVKSIPAFPGKEGHYLKTLLVRITAGSMASPKGYFKHRPAEGEIPGEEEDDEELEPEDGEPPRSGNDAVQAVKKYHAAMKALTNPNLSFWVHHTAYILPQGRTTWWNPTASRGKRRTTSEYESENEDSEMEDEDEDEEEMETPGREMAPPLFQPISEDKAGDGNGPWSLMTSSTVFPEFQVVSVRSNVWPGSYAICTNKGKVANVYFGDGLKFSPISYCPPLMEVAAKEYKAGPELEETQDPSVETEQAWLDKLALKEIEDIEAKFVDNEDGVVTGEEEEDEESDYEY